MAGARSKSDPKPIYVVCGSESFLKQQAIHRIRRNVLGEDHPPLAWCTLDSSASLGEVLDELRTIPMMGDYRLVTLREADDFTSRHRQAIEAYLQTPSGFASLLLVCNHFDARTRLFKLVSKTGEITKCEPLRGQSVVAWITRQAASTYDKKIENPAAWLLRNLAGDDLATLDSELNKLATFVGDRKTIDRAEVSELVGSHRTEKVFKMADAIVEGNAARALELWEQVKSTDRAALGRATGGLAWAIRRYLDAKHRTEQGAAYSELARQFWMEPANLKSMLDRLAVEDLENLLRGLCASDADIKTGLSSAPLAIEKFAVLAAHSRTSVA